ncbi:MAG: antibiotic biosynthesis monooxygenase [Chloroflexi bacterium]|nr:antibiotic biosynthesis monooxygenase [Chloroflexota bacterium]
MSIYVISFRRIDPTRRSRYFELLRQSRERWALSGALLLSRIATSADDPNRLIGVSRWRTAEDFERELAQTPPEVIAAFRNAIVEGFREWFFYRPIREIENFAIRPLTLGIDTLTVPPEEVASFLDLARELQTRQMALPGVAASRILQATHDPTQLVFVNEYATEESWTERRQLRLAVARAFPRVVGRVYLGQIGLQWELATSTEPSPS